MGTPGWRPRAAPEDGEIRLLLQFFAVFCAYKILHLSPTFPSGAVQSHCSDHLNSWSNCSKSVPLLKGLSALGWWLPGSERLWWSVCSFPSAPYQCGPAIQQGLSDHHHSVVQSSCTLGGAVDNFKCLGSIDFFSFAVQPTSCCFPLFFAVVGISA